ncbi:MAG: hypothetical protein IT385_24715 [Deltaproteobacteria bacterium]|nr:hypothetical protein [Deltaproteobacteria bacterium]
MPPRTEDLALALALAVALTACRDEPRDKIVGWPPREPIVPRRDVEEDTSPPVEDVVATEVLAPVEDVAPEVPPCRRIVDLVCELQGRFSDACREAQSRVPDDGHPETRDACTALHASFVADELPRVGSACHRYARELCKTLGEGSEPCRTAKGQVTVLKTRRELRACLGDLLWVRTRTLRR